MYWARVFFRGKTYAKPVTAKPLKIASREREREREREGGGTETAEIAETVFFIILGFHACCLFHIHCIFKSFGLQKKLIQ